MSRSQSSRRSEPTAAQRRAADARFAALVESDEPLSFASGGNEASVRLNATNLARLQRVQGEKAYVVVAEWPSTGSRGTSSGPRSGGLKAALASGFKAVFGSPTGVGSWWSSKGRSSVQSSSGAMSEGSETCWPEPPQPEPWMPSGCSPRPWADQEYMPRSSGYIDHRVYKASQGAKVWD